MTTVVPGSGKWLGNSWLGLVDSPEYRYKPGSGLHHLPDCWHGGTEDMEVISREEAIRRWADTPDVPEAERPTLRWCRDCAAVHLNKEGGVRVAVRHDLLMQSALEVLRDAGGPLRGREVVERVGNRLDLTDYERAAPSENSGQRYSDSVFFSSIDLKAAGWLERTPSGWVITEEGVRALDEIPDVTELRRVAKAAYARKKALSPDDEAAGRRAWLVRGSNVRGVNLVPGWLEDGVVTLSASHLRSVEAGIDRESLKVIIDEDYAHASYADKAERLDVYFAFLTRMQVDDTIVTVDGGHLFIGALTGPAGYLTEVDATPVLAHTAEWFNADGFDIADLPADLAARLKVQSDIVDLTQVLDTIDTILRDGTCEPGCVVEPDDDVVDAPSSLPIRRGVDLPDASAELARELHVGVEWLQECVELLRDRPQLIFYGPPGTGKTFLARRLAQHIAGDEVRLVQFHPSFGYEDFFEGYRPDPESQGFRLSPGPMRRIVDRALNNRSTPHVLIIDEINRGNLAKVFRELYFLLEYRDENVRLMYSDVDFTLPPNVFIIGTMNTADRSIALLDSAMRRRFGFVPLHPSTVPTSGILRSWLAATDRSAHIADLWEELNSRIDDQDFKIGPSYFMRPKIYEEGGLERMWRTAILPLLEEHHFGDLTSDAVGDRYGLESIAAAVNGTASLNGPALLEYDAPPDSD